MHKDSIEKTAFVTADEQYEWLVLPMGLTNAPNSFQRIMNNALSDLTRRCVKVYLDDIIIHSKLVAEHTPVASVGKTLQVPSLCQATQMQVSVRPYHFSRA